MLRCTSPTFLGCVPVKHQPGEVEHSDEPAVGAEGVHEDDTADHSWGGGRWLWSGSPVIKDMRAVALSLAYQGQGYRVL